MTGGGDRLNETERERFDALLHDLISSLHGRLAELVEQVPIVVEDRPSAELVRGLRAEGTLGPDDDGSDVCGLHSGVGLPDRSIEDPSGAAWGAEGGGPEQIYLFREGIIGLALEEPLDWEEEGEDLEAGAEGAQTSSRAEARSEHDHADDAAPSAPSWTWGEPWPEDADERIYEEIRITLLHEIGHHFGLDEEDLEELGYQ